MSDESATEIQHSDLLGIFPRDSTWGNQIHIRDREEMMVNGHISPRVSDGDVFGFQMESGRIGVYRLVDVDNCLDPRDMFFAETEPVGYLDEVCSDE